MSKKTDGGERKRTAELLKQAMAAKKNAAGQNRNKLRPDMGGGRIQPDAERRAGKSRKVH